MSRLEACAGSSDGAAKCRSNGRHYAAWLIAQRRPPRLRHFRFPCPKREPRVSAIVFVLADLPSWWLIVAAVTTLVLAVHHSVATRTDASRVGCTGPERQMLG